MSLILTVHVSLPWEGSGDNRRLENFASVYAHQINISKTNRSGISLTSHVESMGNRKFHKPVGSEEMKVTGPLGIPRSTYEDNTRPKMYLK